MSEQPKWGTPEWHRLHPIFKTDFSKPPEVLIEDIRSAMVQIRGQLTDIRFGYPGLNERLDNVEGLLTCGLVYLYSILEEMKTWKKRDPA